MLIGKRKIDLIDANDGITQFSCIKRHFSTYVTVEFDSTGGNEFDNIEFILGQKYKELPKPKYTKHVFLGWFTEVEGGYQITEDSIVSINIVKLYAHWRYIEKQSYNVNLNSQWSKFLDENPDSNLYDGVYESFSNYNISNGWAMMKINIEGYTDFVIYIKSNAESNYDYTIAFDLDVEPTSLPAYNTTGVKAHTRGKQTSGTSISNFTKVEYNDIDGG
jgi:hypothetical protein